MRLGLLGGTFNPIHNGHLAIGEEVLRACRLDRVLFIPAPSPPHKEVAEEVPFDQRLAMVQAAVAGNPAFAASDLEAHRSGKSYSVDTLAQLRLQRPGDELFFIIGMDSFRDLPTWKEWTRLFALAHVVVLERPGFNADRSLLRSVVSDPALCYDSNTDKIPCQSGNSVIFLKETRLDISSSEIRRRLAENLPVAHLVPQAVLAHIERHHLYRKGN